MSSLNNVYNWNKLYKSPFKIWKFILETVKIKKYKLQIFTMVLKNKRPRDRVKTSGIANKKKKLSYKAKKKENYKIDFAVQKAQFDVCD